jgi:hypothetical protein
MLEPARAAAAAGLIALVVKSGFQRKQADVRSLVDLSFVPN